jgi:hypothetical protein
MFSQGTAQHLPKPRYYTSLRTLWTHVVFIIKFSVVNYIPGNSTAIISTEIHEVTYSRRLNIAVRTARCQSSIKWSEYVTGISSSSSCYRCLSTSHFLWSLFACCTIYILFNAPVTRALKTQSVQFLRNLQLFRWSSIYLILRNTVVHARKHKMTVRRGD